MAQTFHYALHWNLRDICFKGHMKQFQGAQFIRFQ